MVGSRAIYGLKGRAATFSVSNLDDCKRFGVDTQVDWSRQWVAERITTSSRIGVLVHTCDGFFFDTFVPVPQPHPFDNIIGGDINFIKQMYVRSSRKRFNEMKSEPDSYSDICCPMLLHALPNNDMETFFDMCGDLLAPNGNLVLSFSVFSPCDKHTKSILQTANCLRKRNKCVVNEIGFGNLTLLSSAASIYFQLPEAVSLIDEKFWSHIHSGKRSLLQNCRKMFSQNFPRHEFDQLQVSELTRVVAVGVWLKRKCE
jgi:hypothetical protein